MLGNDTDIDGGPKTIESATQPSHGTVVVADDKGSLTYKPAQDYCGTDSFTYKLNGGSTATVAITVTCIDDAPTAADDASTVGENSSATTVDVLANDTDIDAGPKTIESATQPSHGTVVVADDKGSLTYRPAQDYCNTDSGSSPDSFTYKLNGGATATVSVTVTCRRVPVTPRAPADPNPPPAPPLPARAAVSHRSTRVAGNKAKIAVRCGTTGGRCKGTLALAATSLTSRSHAAAASPVAAFDLAPGKTALVAVRVPDASKRQLETRKRVVTRATIRLADGRSVARLVYLYAARR